MLNVVDKIKIPASVERYISMDLGNDFEEEKTGRLLIFHSVAVVESRIPYGERENPFTYKPDIFIFTYKTLEQLKNKIAALIANGNIPNETHYFSEYYILEGEEDYLPPWKYLDWYDVKDLIKELPDYVQHERSIDSLIEELLEDSSNAQISAFSGSCR